MGITKEGRTQLKPVDQTVFNDTLGDCFRACVASIFEFETNKMPNYWEDTQDTSEFWRLNDLWLTKNYHTKALHIQLESEHIFMISGVLCVACAKSPRSDCYHAVVWRNGLIHDPHPSRAGLAEDPDTFTIFVPLDPRCLWESRNQL